MGAKHRKTLKQKIISDYRHHIYTLEDRNFSTPSPTITNTLINSSSHSYSYVLSDVSKTAILTIFIIIGELILFFLLKNHMIVLPEISY